MEKSPQSPLQPEITLPGNPVAPPEHNRQNLDVHVAVPTTHARAVWLFPGLGCRYVGMGNDIIGRFFVVDQLIQEAESFLNYSIAEVCLTGSGRKVVPPRQEAQVIYLLDCAYASVLGETGRKPVAVCGHSLGSLAATTVSGAIDFLTGLKLVTTIEQLFEELVDGNQQAMGVIIGLDELAVASLIAAHSGVSIANRNSPLQYVIGGTEVAVESALGAARLQGAKQARKLVAGRALHTSCMNEVASRLSDHLKSIAWQEPTIPLVSCHNGEVLRTSEEIRGFLSEFLAQPVQWQEAVYSLHKHWGHEFVESGPGNVLTGMMPFIESSISIQTASDILNQKVE